MHAHSSRSVACIPDNMICFSIAEACM